MKNGVKFVVKNPRHFRASFPEERGAAKFHQKFHGTFHGHFHARLQDKYSRQHFCWKWPRSLFRPVQARSTRNARDQDGTGTGRDGPHFGTWMGPKCCRTKHMANLDGTPSDPGWDLGGPRIGPRRGSGWHPQKLRWAKSRDPNRESLAI